VGQESVSGQQVDDASAAAGVDHCLGRELGEEVCALEVGIDRVVPRFCADLHEHRWRKHCGVVDQDVDTTEPLHGLIDHLL
jgi:hypothetical protein